MNYVFTLLLSLSSLSFVFIGSPLKAQGFIASDASDCFTFYGWKEFDRNFMYFTGGNSCNAVVLVKIYDKDRNQLTFMHCGRLSDCSIAVHRQMASRVNRRCVQYNETSVRRSTGDSAC